MARSYRYVDVRPKMIFSDDRAEIIELIKSGEWECSLCPQMFGSNTGYYGMFEKEESRAYTTEDAEELLREIEESGKRAFEI